MNRKIIFLDIDGTLTEPGNNIPPESAVKAIEEARANGHLVFLCTGRNYDMMKPVMSFPLDGFVASSGGYVSCGDELIYDCPMTAEQQVKVLDTLRANGVFCTVECVDGSYTDEGFKEFLAAHAEEEGNSELLRWRKQIEKSLRIRPMNEYDGAPVYKVVCMSPTREGLVNSGEALKEEFNMVIQNMQGTGIYNGEVVNLAFDKGQAVKRVCEFLNIPITDSIGFGDSNNDREMLETVGTAVVMANGSPEMKAIADVVCPAVTEDGMARQFRELGLID